MRVIKDININLIKIDRYPFNPSVLKLINHLERGGSVPPIKVVKDQYGNYIIRDGRHRVLAYKLLGFSKIRAKFFVKDESTKSAFN